LGGGISWEEKGWNFSSSRERKHAHSQGKGRRANSREGYTIKGKEVKIQHCKGQSYYRGKRERNKKFTEEGGGGREPRQGPRCGKLAASRRDSFPGKRKMDFKGTLATAQRRESAVKPEGEGMGQSLFLTKETEREIDDHALMKGSKR